MNATTQYFLSITLAMALALSIIGVMWEPSLQPITAWLLAITVVTFLTFGYDKAVAGKTSRTRVPENILHTLVFLGGTVGALAGMSIFRHKTVKSSFRKKFWGVVIVQVGALAGYYYWIEPLAIVY